MREEFGIAAGELAKDRGERGESHERVAECAEFTRRGAPRGGTRGEALEIAHPIECLAESSAQASLGGERPDGVVARGDPRDGAER